MQDTHQDELNLFTPNQAEYTIKLNTDRHAIDAEVLSDVLLSYKKAVQTVSVGIRDCQAISVDVSAVKSGCVEIHSMIGVLQSVLNPETIPNIITTIKGVVDLYRFLKGRPPQSVIPTGTGCLTIKNCDHSTITVNQTVYQNGYAAAGTPPFGNGLGLKKEGVHSIQVFDTQGVEQAKIDECDFASMVSPTVRMSDPPTENVVAEDELVVETIPIGSPKKKKWGFIRKGQKIRAVIKDLEFIRKITEHQVSFSQGDRIKARINIHSEFNSVTQCMMVKSHQVLNVLEYIPVHLLNEHNG